MIDPSFTRGPIHGKIKSIRNAPTILDPGFTQTEVEIEYEDASLYVSSWNNSSQVIEQWYEH